MACPNPTGLVRKQGVSQIFLGFYLCLGPIHFSQQSERAKCFELLFPQRFIASLSPSFCYLNTGRAAGFYPCVKLFQKLPIAGSPVDVKSCDCRFVVWLTVTISMRYFLNVWQLVCRNTRNTVCPDGRIN